VAIYRILQNSPLGPEDLRRLTDAYEHTLRALSVKDRNDPLAEFIAKKIIEIGQTGLEDPAQISARAIQELALA
jgi:tRNA(Met) C34 N-acetyltransferase TmcA